MNKIVMLSVLILVFVIAAVPGDIQGQGSTTAVTPDDTIVNTDVTAPPANQIIIKFKDNVAENSLMTVNAGDSLPALSAEAGVPLHYFRPMSGDAHVIKLSDWMPIAEVERISAELSALPDVEYAEPDRIKTIDVAPSDQMMMPTLTPNDSLWSQMWHLGYTPNTAEGLNLIPAWDISTGSASTVVAVIDTGILNHTDLAGKTVDGYDFISDAAVGNDGNGRDADPSDPGDWTILNECDPVNGSAPSNSSWHGTHVAGTIGAVSNNNLGITGVNWNAKILPVRVLGKCGGYTSDIVDGMRWAAGLSVSGVSANPNPADVLNLSLGGFGACSTTEQDAINAIVATGATIAIAAGNSQVDASGFSPGNCNNIITVAANDRGGDKAWYSNYGSVVEVTAPGGETSTSANGVLSTLDTGLTTPNNSNSYAFYQGTSMATPHVAGLASLIKGMRPNYTQAQVLSLLQSTARSFPAGSSCNTSICGAGIVDAYQALQFLDITFTDFVYLPIVVKSELPTQPACVPQSGDSNNVNDALLTCSGHTATGQVSGTDLDDVYKIEMEANQQLVISMNGSGGDAHLYLYPPGTTDVVTDPFAASSTNSGNDEYISGKTLTAGYWYIDVFSFDGTTTYNVTASVTNALTGEVTAFSLTPENLALDSRQNK